MTATTNFKSGYSEVNGLNMYYEIYGQGKPLVMIHGGGSTIQTSFGRIIPLLQKHRQVIAVELQAHGRTGDREADLKFEQDADDVAQLLKKLKINKTDILGFSNGGQTAIEIGVRHPEVVNKLIICSSFYKRNGTPDGFWDGFDLVTLEHMPEVLREGHLAVNNSHASLLNMFNKDVQRMKTFKDWSEDVLKSIQAPTLIINATHDVASPEHAVEMYRLIPDCELAIFPGGHGTYLGTIESLENGKWPEFNATHLIEEFLDKEQL